MITRNITTKQKLDDFISKLESRNYNVELVSKKPQIYVIDDHRVNIRCRGKSRVTTYGRSFWYSITFNILQEVEWVIYITTSSDYFFMFPSTFLNSVKDRMYPATQKAGVGVFDLDWDNESIVLRHGDLIHISEYYHNLVHEDDYPRF
jgi:hypothetical protein